jgi:predicted acetyltransferase
MPYDIRPLTPDDQAAAWRLGSIAFGYTDRAMPDGWTSDTPGRHTWGAFDDGRLVAKAVDREQGHWFGGRLVPASGVAGVAVTAELRAQGLAQLVLTRLLSAARDRGAAISTLFPTTPFPYRRVGWEECGALMWAAVPTPTLAAIHAPQGIWLRPAMPDDLPTIRGLYRDAARAGTAMLDRSGPAWDREPDAYLTEYDGVSVAVADDGTVVGYASWDRGPGYGLAGSLTVDDLIATSPRATQALLSVLGGWAAVAPTVRLKVCPGPVVLATAAGNAPIDDRRPWMLRVVNAAEAIAARGWSSHLAGTVELELVDDVCPWNSGAYRLVLDGGEGRLERGGSGGPRFTPRGLALWYAGAAPIDVLRRAGVLTGDTHDDELLQLATAGPAPHVLDYF